MTSNGKLFAELRDLARECLFENKKRAPISATELIAFKLAIITPNTQEGLEPLVDFLIKLLQQNYDPMSIVEKLGKTLGNAE
jgi:hypothetical protein